MRHHRFVSKNILECLKVPNIHWPKNYIQLLLHCTVDYSGIPANEDSHTHTHTSKYNTMFQSECHHKYCRHKTKSNVNICTLKSAKAATCFTETWTLTANFGSFLLLVLFFVWVCVVAKNVLVDFFFVRSSFSA